MTVVNSINLNNVELTRFLFAILLLLFLHIQWLIFLKCCVAMNTRGGSGIVRFLSSVCLII